YVRRAVNESITNDVSRLRERWREPLLTVLTLLLALSMFVLAPLQAVGITGAQDLGFAVVMLAAVGLAVTAANALPSNSLPLSMSV
ncbi:MAG: hypothetical protein WBE50_07200, partial [Methyloceanibacter sp.]